jgi:hypothetical protein
VSDLDEMLEGAALELHRQRSEIMEEDAKEVIMQALKSGDFARYVMPHNQSFKHVYIPFQKKVWLESRIILLERQLECAVEALNEITISHFKPYIDDVIHEALEQIEKIGRSE